MLQDLSSYELPAQTGRAARSEQAGKLAWQVLHLGGVGEQLLVGDVAPR